MPTIMRVDGFRVTIYPNDHSPPHVHVIGAKGEAVFDLNCPEGPVTLRENYGLNGPEVRRLAVQLTKNLAILCAGWKDIHGTL